MLHEMLEGVRERKPLIHNITNYVTVNDCANILLACGGSPIMADDIDEELFERLRELRANIAREEGVPAYIVCNNATLADMTRKRPTDLDELLEVQGVGQAKAARFGQRFLDCIAGRE